MIRLISLWLLMSIIFASNAQSITPIVHEVAWNSDGTLLAVSTQQGKLQIFDMRTNTNRYTQEFPQGGLYLAWHPTELNLLATVENVFGITSPDHLYLIDIATQTVLHQLEVQPAVTELAWNHDGTLLMIGAQSDPLSITNRNSFVVWDHSTQTLRNLILEIGVSLSSFEWSPIDNRIAARYAANQEVYLVVWDIDRETQVSRYVSPTVDGTLDSFSWSPDGSNIAAGVSIGRIGEIDELWLFDPDAGQVIQHIPHSSYITHVAWHPFEELIAIASVGEIRFLNPTTLAETSLPLGEWIAVNDMAWSPYGGRFAISMNTLDQTVNLPNAEQLGATSDLGDGLVQIVVPTPSEALIESIAARCEITMLPALEDLARQTPTSGCEAELRDLARGLIVTSD